MKKLSAKKYMLQIAYTVLLTACAPLALLWISYATKVGEAISTDASGFALLVIFLPVGIYWGVVLVLGICNIVHSFRLYRQHCDLECINSMLILKYGLVVFFCVNFIVLAVFYFMITLGTVVGTRGIAILFAPVLLPWLIITLSFSVFCTWMAIIPGSFYSIQVLRIGYREHKIGIAGFMGHLVWQFLFLADVLDSMYLATKKFGRGKKSSFVIGVVYILGVIGMIWFVAQLI